MAAPRHVHRKCVCVVLLAVSWMLTCSTATAAARQLPPVVDFFRGVLGLDENEKPEEGHDPQAMMIIGAGLSRTGTGSMVVALRRLGFTSYHMQNAARTSGHADMWYDYYVTQTLSLEEVFDSISHLGFNATVDTPLCAHYEALMEKYPEAKVILTVRRSRDGFSAGEVWARSVADVIYAFLDTMGLIPYCWSPKFDKFIVFVKHMFRHLMRYQDSEQWDPDSGLLRATHLPEFYERWNRKVQETVPPDKLLVFNVEEGWGPLCEFLSPISPAVAASCQEIQELGETFPRTNSKRPIQIFLALLRLLHYFVCASPLLMGIWALRRERRKRNDCQTEEQA